MDIKTLAGEVLTHVDEGGDQILLTTESGRTIKIYHEQDCCESVSIQDRTGEWHTLIGKVIVEADAKEEQLSDQKYESATLTTLTFSTNEDTVISRWIGESNGYYSESVDLCELQKA